MSVIDSVKGWLTGRRPERDGDDDAAPPAMRRIELRASENKPRRRLPSFRGLINAPRVESQGQARLERVRAHVRDVFAPTQPVTEEKTFAGRVRLLQRLIEVIEHRMSHVVIYGERGIGKTSLLHILGRLAENSDYIVLRGTCGSKTDFTTLFRTLLKGVPLRFHAGVSPTSDNRETNDGLASLLPPHEFDARELSEVLASVTSTRVLIFLDEYDRIEDENFRQSIAELIKNLSDMAARVQLVIAGVSSNLDELIGYVPSIRRNVIGMPVQRLVRDEIAELLQIGEEGTGLRFAPGAVTRIAELANGSPYLVRLIAYHASMIALDERRTEIGEGDVGQALERMVEETESRLPILIAQRVRALDPGKDADSLAELARMASTPNGWFQIEGQPAAGVARLLDQFAGAALLERRGSGVEESLHFVDEGLPNFLWIVAAQSRAPRAMPQRQPAAVA